MEENKAEIHKPDCSKMEYRYLGNSGLRVSVVGFGNWVNNFNDEVTKECFIKALEKGITASVASCTMYNELGRKVYLSMGSEKNLKLTTTDDIEIFKALLSTQKDTWMH